MVTQTEPYTKEVVVLTASLHNPNEMYPYWAPASRDELAWSSVGPCFGSIWYSRSSRAKRAKQKNKANEKS